MQVSFLYSCQTELTYQLNDTDTTKNWASLLRLMKPEFLSRMDLNHKHGFASMAEIRKAILRLELCAQALGYKLAPLKINNWQHELNLLHYNFPEFFMARKPKAISDFEIAHELNLLIHWLEYELGNRFNLKQQYIINLDFNHFRHAASLKQKISSSELNYFSPELAFGSLHLHYVYIGRHFLEMFDAFDLTSPKTHFKPQHEFSATCGMSFSEPINPLILESKMQDYYLARGGKEFFGIEFDSPKLAKGFFQLGQLQNLEAYQTSKQREALREKLKYSQIISWQIL